MQAVFPSDGTPARIRESAQMEAVLLEPTLEIRMGEAPPDAFPTRSAAIPVEESVARELRSLLVSARSYETGAAKGCRPTPGVRLMLSGEDVDISVLICFECRILTIFEGDRSVGGGSFDPGASRLLHLIRQVFPDDSVIRQLEVPS